MELSFFCAYHAMQAKAKNPIETTAKIVDLLNQDGDFFVPMQMWGIARERAING